MALDRNKTGTVVPVFSSRSESGEIQPSYLKDIETRAR